jgi:hypothetical protein
MCGLNCDRTHPLRKYECVVVITRTQFIYEGVRHANSWQSRLYRPDDKEHAMNSMFVMVQFLLQYRVSETFFTLPSTCPLVLLYLYPERNYLAVRFKEYYSLQNTLEKRGELFSFRSDNWLSPFSKLWNSDLFSSLHHVYEYFAQTPVCIVLHRVCHICLTEWTIFSITLVQQLSLSTRQLLPEYWKRLMKNPAIDSKLELVLCHTHLNRIPFSFLKGQFAGFEKLFLPKFCIY